MKLQETKRKDGQPVYSVVLPKALVEAKQWRKGQELKAVFNHKGNIELLD